MTTTGVVLLSFKYVGDHISHWTPQFGEETRASLAALPNLYVAALTDKHEGQVKVLGGIVAASALDKSSPELASQMKLALETSQFSKDVASLATGLTINPASTNEPFVDLSEQDLLGMAVYVLGASGTGGSA